jgi:hypothetical protein
VELAALKLEEPERALSHVVEENVSFPSPKAERLFFRSSGSARCAGKTDVFGYEHEWALACVVEENVSFPAPKAERICFRPSGSARCAVKTDVFGYELELALAWVVEENVSFSCSEGRAAFLSLIRLGTLRGED